MEKKLYKIFSICLIISGIINITGALLIYFDDFLVFDFLFFFISGVAFIVLHRRLANMFTRFFSPIIKFCIYLLKD